MQPQIISFLILSGEGLQSRGKTRRRKKDHFPHGAERAASEVVHQPKSEAQLSCQEFQRSGPFKKIHL